MCRFFALNGNFSNDFYKIFRSIQEVASNDKYLKMLYGEDLTPNHPDGWGFVNFNGIWINFQKFKDPIYESNIPNIDNGYLLLHARKASKGQPLGALNAHPFHRSFRNSEIFMVHNGGVKKELLKVKNIDISSHTDTETFLFSIKDKENILDSLRDAFNSVENEDLMIGSLNIAILNIERDGQTRIFAYSDYSKESNYVKLYFIRHKDWCGIFSSTITESEYFPEYESKEVLNKKEIYELLKDDFIKLR